MSVIELVNLVWGPIAALFTLLLNLSTGKRRIGYSVVLSLIVGAIVSGLVIWDLKMTAETGRGLMVTAWCRFSTCELDATPTGELRKTLDTTDISNATDKEMIQLAKQFMQDESPATLIELAKRENSKAQLLAGFAYFYGVATVPQNQSEAKRYFSLAAAQGEPIAQRMIGRMYRDHLGGLPKNDSLAIENYEHAVKQGNVIACLELETIVYGYKDCISIYSGSDNEDAQTNLAWNYYNGYYGYPKDEKKTLDILIKLAKKGNAEAISHLQCKDSKSYTTCIVKPSSLGFLPGWKHPDKDAK